MSGAYNLRRSLHEAMQILEIDDKLMAEICEAANFEGKSCAEYVKSALREAVRSTENQRLLPEKIERFNKSYEAYPHDLDDSEEEWAHWRKVYEEFERSEKWVKAMSAGTPLKDLINVAPF